MRNETATALASCPLPKAMRTPSTKTVVVGALFRDGAGWTFRFIMKPLDRLCSWCVRERIGRDHVCMWSTVVGGRRSRVCSIRVCAHGQMRIRRGRRDSRLCAYALRIRSA